MPLVPARLSSDNHPIWPTSPGSGKVQQPTCDKVLDRHQLCGPSSPHNYPSGCCPLPDLLFCLQACGPAGPWQTGDLIRGVCHTTGGLCFSGPHWWQAKPLTFDPPLLFLILELSDGPGFISFPVYLGMPLCLGEGVPDLGAKK